ncbi:MAG: hypothetical protein V3T58_03085 [Candidatus Hydrothermarchaeales archaeon]
MSFLEEESGQIGPFEELFELIIVVILILIFSATIAYSYREYDARKDPIERFSAGLDFASTLKNSILCVRVNGAPNPGLIDRETLLQKGNFIYLNRYWNKPYNWEVVIRGTEGALLYEFGSLNKEAEDPANPQAQAKEVLKGREVSVVFTVIAYKTENKEVVPARMEVWVW